MRTRLVFAGKERGTGKLVVDVTTCPHCDCDVFEWIDSYQTGQFGEGGVLPLGMFRCVYCHNVSIFDESKYLLEAADDEGAWFARLHAEQGLSFEEAARWHPAHPELGGSESEDANAHRD